MSKFNLGDRVQVNGHPADRDIGTVATIYPRAADTLSQEYDVDFDNSGFIRLDDDDMFLVLSSAPAVPYTDPVNKPSHYTSDPSGVECITITRHRNFNIGNAIKYLWRNGLKESGTIDGLAKQIQDLEKAKFYITDEITRLEGTK